MPVEEQSTTVTRSAQSGLAFVDGFLILGIYVAQREFRDTRKFVEIDGEQREIIIPEKTITFAGETKAVGVIHERLGTRLRVHRAKDGTQILVAGRTSIFASMRRIRQMEKEHRVQFDFVPASAVPENWDRLPKDKRLEIACQIARGYVASDADLPEFFHNKTAPLLPSPKPSPAVSQKGRAIFPHLNTASGPTASAGECGLFIFIAALGLLVLTLGLLRGTQVAFGGAVAAVAAYGALAYALIHNRLKRTVREEVW